MVFRELEHKSTTVENLIEKLGLEILLNVNLSTKITSQSVYRVGYELSGFFLDGEELTTNINVLGRKECIYLESVDPKVRKKTLEKYLSFPFPVLIITCDTKIIKEIVEIAKKYGKPVLKSKYRTTEFIRNTKFYLQKVLSDEIILNDYILLDIYGVGILITGYEDARLGATVELLERGHKFITDTRLKIQNIANRFILGSNTATKTKGNDHFYLFGKDGNNIDVTTHFGIKSTRKSKKVTLLIELEKWNEKKFYDRLGLDEVYEEFLGFEIPKVTLPVRKGRNLAIIIETAAINYRLKKTGENSAEYFWKESRKLIEENKINKKRGDGVNEKTSMPVSYIKSRFDLNVINGEEHLKTRYITTTGVHRPSLALTGYFDMYDQEGYKGIQLFGPGEFNYLEKLTEEERNKNLSRYFEEHFPVVIVSKIEKIPEYFLDIIKEKDVILLETSLDRPSHIVATFSAYLENYFAPSISLHGVFVELYGFGVLLTGKSGIGKSETALELIHRGHRLIADDAVRLEKGVIGDITGRASKLPYFMEIRGLGIIDVKALYGVGAVRISKRLDIIIELQELKSEDYLTAMDYQESSEIILGNEIPKFKLYISSGRNAAAMVEIAVMNLMAKRMGYNSDEMYLEEMKKKIKINKTN
ncbi:HPr(Ser) kinase/phosphatase [uncultured Cetobacterium sp.]|uniref:HPr(Ser) kinase/phosphatase n=2 Tax=uncultured Cetobacterium sp. TaxID=527638 RepID=UPI00260A664E|nr:HPr(Ser) kinase/phosphatase [uncultured Cetobacterium sp.]